jgi:hypothetical protein
MNLEAISLRIANGENVSSSELLPHLCLEQREQRANVNLLLAKAYQETGRKSDLQQAKVFIERAWLLSRFSRGLLPLYLQIHSSLDDIAGIRDAYKRVGMKMASRGNIREAIRYFDLWQYAYVEFRNLDKYEYDFDILDCVDRLAQPYRLSPPFRRGVLKDGKIRVAYLVKGINELGSVLVKINLLFARFHDRSRVDPVFFVPESENSVVESAVGREHLELFKSYGCEVRMPKETAFEKRLLAVGKMINDVRPDVLITSAALADFEHYFITSLRPAPWIIGLVQGPPQQFSPLNLDWGVAWSKHPLIDTPVSCSLIDFELEFPERNGLVPYGRHEVGIPESALVMASAGRCVKFQEPEFWQAIFDLLADHPQTYYLALGVEESQVPFLSSMLTAEIRSRIRFVGWQGKEYLRSLCLADIFIDTFPSGGGVTLIDAIALGIPALAFKNDYLRAYDQTDWSPAEEFVMPEIVAPHGNFAEMKRMATRLIENEEYRRDIALRCQEQLRQRRSNPERAVRACEDIYLRVLERELSAGKSRTASRWIAGPVRQLTKVLRRGERMLDRIAERKS